MQVEIRDFAQVVTDVSAGGLYEQRVQAVVGGNTEAAEQCFEELRMSSRSLRSMGVWASRTVLAFRVHAMNSMLCRKRYNTTLPTDGPLSRRWKANSLSNPCFDI